MTEAKYPSDYFSRDYAEARERFRDATRRRGCKLFSYPIENDSELSIDVATIGRSDAKRATIISSGVHGVEGFFGSAVQLAWLDAIADDDPSHRIVLIHAVNPFGFAHLRRWNEDNVDLNRNFLSGDAEYAGAPVGYLALNGLLNPKSPPSPWEPFKLKSLWTVARSGMSTVKQAVAGGQYEYPQGLFFGGKQASVSTRIVQQYFATWVGGATEVVHLDLHSGLGKSARCLLLLLESASNEAACRWYRDAFANTAVEPLSQETSGTGYDTSGSMGGWLIDQNRHIDYRFACAEIGTHNVIRVLAALRAENRAHFYGDRNDKSYQSAKRELLECFCPASEAWREQVIRTGTQLIEQAKSARL